MPYGKAPIAEQSAIDALIRRRWSHRRPVSGGVLYSLTAIFWALWVYLVLPLLGLVLWYLGIQLFIGEMIDAGAYETLVQALASYSTIFLALVVLLGLWIVWNVVRYGGERDRRTVKRPGITDEQVMEAYRLDNALLADIRGARVVRLDVSARDTVVVIEDSRVLAAPQ